MGIVRKRITKICATSRATCVCVLHAYTKMQHIFLARLIQTVSNEKFDEKMKWLLVFQQRSKNIGEKNNSTKLKIFFNISVRPLLFSLNIISCSMQVIFSHICVLVANDIRNSHLFRCNVFWVWFAWSECLLLNACKMLSFYFVRLFNVTFFPSWKWCVCVIRLTPVSERPHQRMLIKCNDHKFKRLTRHLAFLIKNCAQQICEPFPWEYENWQKNIWKIAHHGWHFNQLNISLRFSCDLATVNISTH